MLLQFDVGVFLRLGPVRLFVPVELSNIQFKVRCLMHRAPQMFFKSCLIRYAQD